MLGIRELSARCRPDVGLGGRHEDAVATPIVVHDSPVMLHTIPSRSSTEEKSSWYSTLPEGTGGAIFGIGSAQPASAMAARAIDSNERIAAFYHTHSRCAFTSRNVTRRADTY